MPGEHLPQKLYPIVAIADKRSRPVVSGHPARDVVLHVRNHVIRPALVCQRDLKGTTRRLMCFYKDEAMFVADDHAPDSA